MYEVQVFNPSTRTDTTAMSEDVSTLRVEEFTVEDVFEAMKAQSWHFGAGGIYAALKLGGGNDSLLVFEVDRPPSRWEATPL